MTAQTAEVVPLSPDPNESFRASAVAAAEAGDRVFRLVPGGKTPAFKDWQTEASSDPERVRRLWTEPMDGAAEDWNIGVMTGSELVVVDVDVKNGKPGAATVKALREELGPLPPTYTVRTPSDGSHGYFTVPPGVYVPNSVEKLGPGLDIRGDGGYVVGPGSVVDGREYYVGTRGRREPLPAEYLARIAQPRPPERQRDTTPPEDLDDPANVERAAAWLRDQAPVAVEKAGGDHQTFKVACGALGYKLSVPVALELLLENWNERCSPPWAPDELERKIENADRYRRGNADDFDDVSAEQAAKAAASEAEAVKRPKLYAVPYDRSAEMALDDYAEPLVDELLDQGAMCVAYGDSNTGKTFVMLQMGYCIAAGQPFNGSAVRQGAVAYVAAEGGRNIHRRIAALRKRYGGTGLPLVVIPCPISLLSPQDDTAALIRLLQEEQARIGQAFALVVIDTLSRAFAGGDENASTDMGAFVANVDRIRSAIGSTLAIVHHTGKDKAKGARGHSSLRAATDTEIEIEPGKFKATKQRDMPLGPAIAFCLADVTIGDTPEGRRVSSAVVEWMAAAPGEDNLIEKLARALAGRPEGAHNAKTLMIAAGLIAAPHWKHGGRDKLLAAFDGAEAVMTESGKLEITLNRGAAGIKLRLLRADQ